MTQNIVGFHHSFEAILQAIGLHVCDVTTTSTSTSSLIACHRHLSFVNPLSFLLLVLPTLSWLDNFIVPLDEHHHIPATLSIWSSLQGDMRSTSPLGKQPQLLLRLSFATPLVSPSRKPRKQQTKSNSHPKINTEGPSKPALHLVRSWSCSPSPSLPATLPNSVAPSPLLFTPSDFPGSLPTSQPATPSLEITPSLPSSLVPQRSFLASSPPRTHYLLSRCVT